MSWLVEKVGHPGEPFSQNRVLSSCPWSFFPLVGDRQSLEASEALFCAGGGGGGLDREPPICYALGTSSTSPEDLPPSPRPPPPLPVSRSHFAARIVIRCELDLLAVTSELGVHILLHPTHAPPLNWIISFRLLRLQFCLMVTQASTQNRCYSEIWCRMYL